MPIDFLDLRRLLRESRHRRRVFLPARDLRDERFSLTLAERGDALGLALEEGMIIVQIEDLLLDTDRGAPLAEIFPQPAQLLFRDRVETDLIEEAQQPRLARRKDRVLQKLVPDGSVRPTS